MEGGFCRPLPIYKTEDYMKIRTSANGMIYWGTSPLPAGATCLGVVYIENKPGALIKTGDGRYHFGKRGGLGVLIPNTDVEKALNRSAVFSEIGSIKSEKKAAASAANGSKGGRPAGSKDSKPRARKKKDISG
jgi:hypothetical protein